MMEGRTTSLAGPPYVGFIPATELRQCDGLALCVVNRQDGKVVEAWLMEYPLDRSLRELRRYYKEQRPGVIVLDTRVWYGQPSKETL